jgi:hypothetical protein
MLFFQIVLLLGYLYAHYSTRWLGRRQPYVHLALMATAGLTLPFVLPGGFAARGGTDPTLGLLTLLAIAVGASFFVISAGAPLLQRWFANTIDPAAKDPYFLYSASNLGSMLALLAYPFLIEPRLRLLDQTELWRILYFVLLGAMAVSALAMTTRLGTTQAEAQEEVPAETITAQRRWRWVLLAAVPSSLMLGTTSYLTTNIAPMPMIWVGPLALYLLSYILAFLRKPVLSNHVLERIFSVVVVPLAFVMIMESHEMALTVLHVGVFFVTAWMCHQLLATERPTAARLTEFYVFLSIGGMVGGLFNAVVAPLLFNNLYEYPIALVAAVLLRPPLRPKAAGFIPLDVFYALACGVIAVAAVFAWRQLNFSNDQLRIAVVAGVPCVIAFLAVDRSYRFGLALAAIFGVTTWAQLSASGQLLSLERSFYGVHRVTKSGSFHRMVHGNTIHGQQRRDGEDENRPLTYYYPNGPMGQMFEKYGDTPLADRVALVGLGVGSLAAYGRPGQEMTFYEIDPLVETMARNPKLFTFLERSKARVDVVLGDARLTLSEAPEGRYGIIVLDAFTSDAVPVHLLTREAIAMYMSKLEPHGILALHISNRYLRLLDVVTAAARDLGLRGMRQYDGALDPDDKLRGKTASHYVILARSEADLEPLTRLTDRELAEYESGLPPSKTRKPRANRTDSRWDPIDQETRARAWTDDYSDILSVWSRGE